MATKVSTVIAVVVIVLFLSWSLQAVDYALVPWQLIAPAPGTIGATTPAAGSFTTLKGTTLNTTTNCADSAGAAACTAAAAGHFVIDAAATSVVVSTTAVTANSEIHVTRDDSLGTLLSVTCNTQSSLTLGTPRITARTAATSFTVTIEVGPTTDPLCLGYTITN